MGLLSIGGLGGRRGLGGPRLGLDDVDADATAGAGNSFSEGVEGGLEGGDILGPGDGVAGQRDGRLDAEFVHHFSPIIRMRRMFVRR